MKPRLDRRFAFPLISVVLGLIAAFGLLLLGEIAVRYATHLNFLGNSSHLFSAERFGPSRGNASLVHAVSFEADVYTDANGLRVPSREYLYPPAAEKHLLIIGDSIAFGPGVEEPLTFAGLLREIGSKNRWNVYNAAVIGHDVNDYLNVILTLVSQNQPLTKVLLFYCLNDVSTQSAVLLDAADTPKEYALVERLRSVELTRATNEFLRERSKLFLFLKGMLTDPSARYFVAEYVNYEADERKLGEKLEPLGRLGRELKARGIDFLVIICPYEYQLRGRSEIPGRVQADIFAPQRTVQSFLKSRQIPFRDATEHFLARAKGKSSRFFLPFDPMHFSAEGHRLMFEFVSDVLN
jgi:lysophospholipase L1-like esterase